MSDNVSEKEQKHFDNSIDWETSRVEMVEKSEKKAWWVAGSSVFLVVLSWIALALLMPLKEKVPYLLVENTATGTVEVIGSLDIATLTYSEVRDKHWIDNYILARESYDWNTLTKTYNTVARLSNPDVAYDYQIQFEGDKALDKLYRNNVKVVTKVISIIASERGTATVRFSKTTKRTDSKGKGKTTIWVATVAYQYFGSQKMAESDRVKNPYGFTVTSYRVDPELVGDNQ
jgi:type IV secretion system protein VirB8